MVIYDDNVMRIGFCEWMGRRPSTCRNLRFARVGFVGSTPDGCVFFWLSFKHSSEPVI